MTEARISSAEAARRLGVKIPTLYAYVSRGLLRSHRSPNGRGSVFDRDDVEALARQSGRRQARPASVVPFRSVSSSVSAVQDGDLLFRGRPAAMLAAEARFPDAALSVLFGGARPGTAPRARESALRAALADLRRIDPQGNPAPPTGARRIRLLLELTAAHDPLRASTSDERIAETAVTAVLAALAAAATETEGGWFASAWSGFARRTGADVRLVAPPAVRSDPLVQRAFDCALVILMDHGLAVSTVAARVAASARADPYACTVAALSAFEGPLHGLASARAHRMLERILQGTSASTVVDEELRHSGSVPGMGHPLYPEGDPRAALILALLRRCSAGSVVVDAVDQVEAVTEGTPDARANVDLALAALTVTAGLPAAAGESVFAVSRTVGWCAHALEEYDEAPLRWRGRQ